MTLALFVYWVVPVLCLALYARLLADTSVPTVPVDDHRPTTPRRPQQPQQHARKQQPPHVAPSPQPRKQQQQQLQNFPSQWPTAYRDTVQAIAARRRNIAPGSFFAGGIHQQLLLSSSFTVDDTSDSGIDDNMSPKSSNNKKQQKSKPKSRNNSNNHSRGNAESNSVKAQWREKIERLRQDFEEHHPDDLYRGIAAADAMRLYDLQFHEGGTYEQPALQLYERVIAMAAEKRNAAIEAGEPTRNNDGDMDTVSDEVTLEYPAKSWDGLLCALHAAHGKALFMANLFARAVHAYDNCLERIDGNYLDAANARGSALVVLGRYPQAGRDFWRVVTRDRHRYFHDAFTGLARVLEAAPDDESLRAMGITWDSVVALVEQLVPAYDAQLEAASASQPEAKKALAPALNRLHHVLFTYHDVQTHDYPTAFAHLRTAFAHKLSVLPPWNQGSERQKIAQTKTIFHRHFWSGLPTGSPTKTPIFIVGFPRSGSTLLERILDAHPQAAGTGENSVFNGRLDDIRNQIVRASSGQTSESMSELTHRLADEVVDEMRRRWEIVDANMQEEDETQQQQQEQPERLVDKMLTNYYNIGFIQMLYPNALILHVARNPMDTIFSAYKHEFPPGTLDYTSDYDGLAELYGAYREIMEHWDDVLPGRITHVKYEDMVQDFEGVARAIVRATGLPWDDGVLEFHKKKHAVNTMSTTQVRKGIYRDSLQAWKRYERELQPLVDKIGDRVRYDLKTTVPGYQPPAKMNE